MNEVTSYHISAAILLELKTTVGNPWLSIEQMHCLKNNAILHASTPTVYIRVQSQKAACDDLEVKILNQVQ